MFFYLILVSAFTKYNSLMIRSNILYLILAITLISVPVIQTVHTLTHVTDVDTISMIQIDSIQDKSDDDADIDKICLDCLALTTYSDISFMLVFPSYNQVIRQQLSFLTLRYTLQNFSSDYHSRAPPLA
jgi:hypothetical protein